MSNKIANKYFVRKNTSLQWEDVTTKFVGLNILSLAGMNEQGDAINVYDEQWTNSQVEDFLVTTKDAHNNDVIIRKNVDLSLTFIVGKKYGALDVQSVHDAFVEYVCSGGDFYIKSAYTSKEAHVICLKSYKPTLEKLQRSFGSFIMGTITLHCLEAVEATSEPILGDLYIGFGASAISSMSDITSLTNVQHYNKDDAAGTYVIQANALSYLWICSSTEIRGVSANGFTVPMNSAIHIGELFCYRTTSNIKPHTMRFTIET